VKKKPTSKKPVKSSSGVSKSRIIFEIGYLQGAYASDVERLAEKLAPKIVEIGEQLPHEGMEEAIHKLLEEELTRISERSRSRMKKSWVEMGLSPMTRKQEAKVFKAVSSRILREP